MEPHNAVETTGALTAAIVGARTVRQGTGPYLARELDRCGCHIQAVVGRTASSAEAARQGLARRYGIRCRGYASLRELLANEPVDLVVVASPAERHLENIRTALAADCHVLCEKPLWWPRGARAGATGIDRVRTLTRSMTAEALRRQRLLAVNTQWPFTLDAFRELHPNVLDTHRVPTRFAMWMAPRSRGGRMVVDAAPHLLSMLYALVGGGQLADIAVHWTGVHRAVLVCRYLHQRGRLSVQLHLRHTRTAPRPAGYSIDGRAVERRVAMPSYELLLEYNGARRPLRDPLTASIGDFLGKLRGHAKTDEQTLVTGMVHLAQLASAAGVLAPPQGMNRIMPRTVFGDRREHASRH